MQAKHIFYSLVLGAAAGAAQADIVVPMKMVNDQGTTSPVGQVTISESKYGLVFTPTLTHLKPGLHGFHIHANPSCQPKEKDGKMVAALDAGGHFDPRQTNKHSTAWGDGHLGYLPGLFVDATGNAIEPVLAPRLKMSDVTGHALMIHVGGDNHSDDPAPLGGGGARMACGIIK